MKKISIAYIVFFSMLIAGMAVSSMGCMGMGTMDGEVGVNINDQPVWGPSGYDRADFYYIPDIDSYYSVSERQYIYRDGSDWKHGSALPARYSSYDPYHSYKVVINEDKPYQRNQTHQSKYGSYKGKTDQPVIRDSRDPKYFSNKDHPEHDNWKKQHEH